MSAFGGFYSRVAAAKKERKETHLSLDGVTTLFTQIHKEENATPQMSQSSDTLHLDRVHLLQGMVQHSRGVNDLPSKVLVVHVSNKETLGRESVRLNVDVGSGYFVDEGRFSDVGVTTDEESSGRRVDGRETGHVLSDLLEVGERIFLSSHDGSHSNQTPRGKTSQLSCTS